MRILHVIASMDPLLGGISQGLRNMIPELEKLGAHNEVVSLDRSEVSFLNKDLFTIHALGPGRQPWYYSGKLFPWLLANINRFDVLIVHGLWLYHGYTVQRVIRQVQSGATTSKLPKVFVMPHGMLDPYFQQATGRKLKALRNWIYWKWIEEKIINNADGLLFTCEIERQLSHTSFRPYHPRSEHNVGLGMTEPPPFTTAMCQAFKDKCPEISDHPYLLFISRIHKKKGVDLLIKAFEKILQLNTYAALPVGNLPGINHDELILAAPKELRLIIAGPGLNTAYGHRIQQLVAQSPRLRYKVFFPGMLTDDAKWGAFYGCEAFVLPSHQENFGIAVVEALACGKPVLISDQVNIWPEVKAGGGCFVAEDTLEGTQQTLRSWFDLLPQERHLMEQHARQTFERHFAIGPSACRLWEAINH